MSKRISKDEIDRFHDYSIYIPKRAIYVGAEDVSAEHGESGTDAAMAERLIKNLTILEGINSDPITIIMNNTGGDVSSGLAIFDAIVACKSHVTIKIFGECSSMGSVILQAADERIMSPNSVQMIHYGSVEIAGHDKTIVKYAKEVERLDNWLENMYLKRIQQKQPAFKLSRLKSMLNHDTFLTAEQSVTLGLADKILTSED